MMKAPKKRILFVDHVSRILGGAEVNIVELLGAEETKSRWNSACACPQDAPLAQALKSAPAPTFDYGFDSAMNELRIVGKRFSFARAVHGFTAVRAAKRRLAEVVERFDPMVIVSCTNKDHFAATPVGKAAGTPVVWWVNDIMSEEFFPRPALAAFYWAGQTRGRKDWFRSRDSPAPP